MLRLQPRDYLNLTASIYYSYTHQYGWQWFHEDNALATVTTGLRLRRRPEIWASLQLGYWGQLWRDASYRRTLLNLWPYLSCEGRF